MSLVSKEKSSYRKGFGETDLVGGGSLIIVASLSVIDWSGLASRNQKKKGVAAMGLNARNVDSAIVMGKSRGC